MSDTEETNKGVSTSKQDTSSHTPSLSPCESPNHLDISSSKSPAKAWQLWKQMWENYAIVTNLASQPKEYKKAVFLCTIVSGERNQTKQRKGSAEDNGDRVHGPSSHITKKIEAIVKMDKPTDKQAFKWSCELSVKIPPKAISPYACRALTDAETRYATIEKEMLTAIFALEKWHQFTYGRFVKVYTDQKPLVSITNKLLEKAPRRLQGMLLRSFNYNIEVEYVPGSQQYLADMMSRSFMPLNSPGSQKEFETVNTIRFIPMTQQKVKDVRQETEKDETLNLLRETIQHGFPEHKSNISPQLTPYFHIRDELSVYNGIIFKGERLVIPNKMRDAMKRDLHAAHTGVEGCLRRARECVYWPGINAEIKEWISTCETCRECEAASQHIEPLLPMMLLKDYGRSSSNRTKHEGADVFF
ncbi:Transposon Ty3-I Gag-Pol polyprotein [Exaiptasia diaphana]|nr:Transposon Ty3-I Gag-Pol polyprotein [Exaiptasia diaphana]